MRPLDAEDALAQLRLPQRRCKVTTPAPIAMFAGTADEEVSPLICQHVVVSLYIGATRDFDDPGAIRRKVPANVATMSNNLKKWNLDLEVLQAVLTMSDKIFILSDIENRDE